MKSKKPNKFNYDTHDDGLNPMSPIKKHIPDWYKNLPVQNYKKLEIVGDINVKKSVKNCVPFLDAMTTGYCIELWADVLVSKDEGDQSHRYMWHEGPKVLKERGMSDGASIAIPTGHSKTEYVWINPYSIKLPKGYSAIFTHPLNRHDLPFTTITGIVDADWEVNGGNMPFYLKEDFTGVIPAGTPIIQIIPFKREDWKLEREEGLAERSNYNRDRSLRVFFNWYRNTHWKKKNFD